MAMRVIDTCTLSVTERHEHNWVTISSVKSNVLIKDVLNWQPSPEAEATLSMLDRQQPTSVSNAQLVQLGQDLYSVLFTPSIVEAFIQIGSQRRSTDDSIRIRLVVEPSELAVLPWELMHDGQDFIALRANFPLVRSMGGIEISQRTTVRGPIRILYAGASPEDLPVLSLKPTAEELKEMLTEKRGQPIKFDILLDATVEDLRTALLKDYHIFCFAGHGTADGIFLQTETRGKTNQSGLSGSL